MFGTTGVLIALMVLTIVLAGAFLVRSSITAGTTGKILAFMGLCVLPALCIDMGMSFHMDRSEQTRYCISCHSMETHGESLYLADPSYIPAQHFQNHLVPTDKACYTCHSNYTIYGPLKDKLDGLRYIYMTYVSTPPKEIHIKGGFPNLACLHCHAGARGFIDSPAMAPIMGSLTTDKISCLTCHNMIHNASEVGHLKMWVPGNAPTSLASASSSTAPAKAQPAAPAGPAKAAPAATPPASAASAPAPAKAKPTAAAGPAKAGTASSPGDAAATQGKGIFDSQRCSGCHGAAGAGGVGPALTHISSQYPPAKLTAVLKAPTAKMKAAGMVPLTLNSADMKALVSYVSSLGGASAASAATPSASAASAPAPAKAEPSAAAGPAKTSPVTTPPASAASAPAPAKAEPSAAAGPAKASTGSSAGGATTGAAQGKSIFDSHGCGGCHGASGGGGAGPALTDISSKYPPAKLTALLKAPTAKMKAGGMTPLTLNADDMKALVSYVTSLGGSPAASGATPPAPGPSSTAAAKAEPAATAGASKAESKGQAIFKAYGCADCHGTNGVGGTAAAPALAGTGKSLAPELLTTMLKHPTASMQQGGMPPISVSGDELKALVAYLSSISASKSPSR